MALNNNIFVATNPMKMLDALYKIIQGSNVNIEKCLIFLPSRRAVRSAEKMFVDKSGKKAVLLPKLVALGEGAPDENLITDDDVFQNSERVVLLAKLLSQDKSIVNMSVALQIAHDFIAMQDYLENEGVDTANINWIDLVDEKYASHFKNKADLLNILTRSLPIISENKITSTALRNNQIRHWIDVIKKDYLKDSLVVVCGSTASVPASADLMAEIAKLDNGRIILSGKISGKEEDFLLDTNPYNAEYKFLNRVGVKTEDINIIDVGDSKIDFFNYVFSNDLSSNVILDNDLQNCHLIEANTEAQEAKVVAEIVKNARQQKKSVMVITPDSAGNQRIKSAFQDMGIVADFSGAMSGDGMNPAKALLNLFDSWIENGSNIFDKIYVDANYNLFDCVVDIIEKFSENFEPKFSVDDENYVSLWMVIRNLSDVLIKYDIRLSLSDARAFVADAVSSVDVRQNPVDNPDVVVLGTIEARMQTADVIILTGLNDGMFPAQGYKNSWLPINVSKKIGLPSPDRKVSLMALDFMNLSCAKEVYWLRSKVSGGVQTVESRFLSRVVARKANIDVCFEKDILSVVNKYDVVDYKPLSFVAPVVENDWSDVFVTELETLIHNPYVFYCKHILRLKPKDDWWVGPDARNFGLLVHDVIEHAKSFDKDVLIHLMDVQARELLGNTNILLYFWHKRFVEIAELVFEYKDLLLNSKPEINGVVNIAGRNVRARADRVWDGGVLDIKTGEAPSSTQLLEGNMPQLPLEAFILQSGGFPLHITEKSKTPVIKFLQLRNSDVKMIEYDFDLVEKMMNGAIQKVIELVNMYSAGSAPYDYYITSGKKYKAFDDLARIE